MDGSNIISLITNIFKRVSSLIRPKHMYIVVFILGLYIVLGFLSSKIVVFDVKNSIKDRKILINQNSSEVLGQIMWWSFVDNDIILNYTVSVLKKNEMNIYGLTKNGTAKIPNDEHEVSISDDFTGSFYAVSSEVLLDMNGDDKDDKTVICCKADTIFTRGFVPINTYSASDEVLFEPVIKGNTDLVLYFKKEPILGKRVFVTSKNGYYDEVMTDEKTGMIHFDNINILRRGINLIYVNNGIYYVTSYIVEGHNIFSNESFSAIFNLFILLTTSAILIIIIVFVRKLMRFGIWIFGNKEKL